MLHSSKSILNTAISLQIVITGLGAVTPVGIGAEEAYQAMCAGKSGIVKLPSWADEYPAQVSDQFYHMQSYAVRCTINL